MNIKKIGNAEAIALIAIIATNQIILNLPKRIILSTGSSAWLNIIYISIIAVLLTLFVVKLLKRFSGRDILDISEFLGGKWLKIGIGVLFIFIILLSPALLIRDFSESLRLIYYKDSPILYIILFFIIGAVVANKLGLNIISKVNLITLPIILFSILIILFSTAGNFIPQRIFPVLGYGINETFFKGLSNIFSFNGIAVLYFLPPLLKKQENFKRVSIIAIVISAIYLILSILCLLLAFSFITFTKEPLSLYLITRMVKYGHFFQRTDALFILLWILSSLSYLSISFFFIVHIFKKISNIFDQTIMVYCFGAIFLGLCLIPNNVAHFNVITDGIYKYSTIAIIFIISPLILVFANLKARGKKGRLLNNV